MNIRSKHFSWFYLIVSISFLIGIIYIKFTLPNTYESAVALILGGIIYFLLSIISLIFGVHSKIEEQLEHINTKLDFVAIDEYLHNIKKHMEVIEKHNKEMKE